MSDICDITKAILVVEHKIVSLLGLLLCLVWEMKLSRIFLEIE